jgi:hypothetical protein
MLLIRHMNKYAIPILVKLSFIKVPRDFGEFGVRCIHHMFKLELSPVAVETVGNEYWDIVQPGISGSGAEEYPTIMSRDS